MISICDYLVELIPKEMTDSYIGEVPGLDVEGVALSVLETDDPITSFTGNSIYRPVVTFNVRYGKYEEGSNLSELLLAMFDKYHDDNILGMITLGSTIYLGRVDDFHEFQLKFKIMHI